MVNTLNILVVVLISLSVCSALRTEGDYKLAFTDYVQKFQKVYSSANFAARYATFKFNLDYVEAWNAENNGVTLEMNKFADLSSAEFKETYLSLNYDYSTFVSHNEYIPDLTAPLPTSVDWTTKGVVTPVKDQGQCGSCWSFSTTGSTEGAWAIAGHPLVGLSEQNLMDCSTSYGNQGCDGGLMDYAFEYIIANKGIDTEASYPYTTADGTCHFTAKNVGATISSYKDIPSKNETALQVAAANIGPISVAIDASHNAFQLYKTGVYHQLLCSQTRLDHGVLVAGYGVDGSDDYWLVKNSWGADWGQQGYIWMSRNRDNNCGIATAASFPLV
jgi:cathepsin L